MANPLKTLHRDMVIRDEVSSSRHQLSKIGGDGQERTGARSWPRNAPAGVDFAHFAGREGVLAAGSEPIREPSHFRFWTRVNL